MATMTFPADPLPDLCKSIGPVSRTLHMAYSKNIRSQLWKTRVLFNHYTSCLMTSAVFLVRPTLAASRPGPCLGAEPERGGIDSTLWATLTSAPGSGRASLG